MRSLVATSPLHESARICARASALPMAFIAGGALQQSSLYLTPVMSGGLLAPFARE